MREGAPAANVCSFLDVGGIAVFSIVRILAAGRDGRKVVHVEENVKRATAHFL